MPLIPSLSLPFARGGDACGIFLLPLKGGGWEGVRFSRLADSHLGEASYATVQVLPERSSLLISGFGFFALA